MKHEKLVAAYVRVSTSEQKKNGYGIRIQRRDVREFARRLQLPIDRFYSDAAQSGVLENRKQLDKLLRDCERGLVGTIIIPSPRRLARRVRIAENLFWRLSELGVHVLIADMPNYDQNNRKDVMVRQIREAIDEENRTEIIEKLWKGRCERVRGGKPAGGMVPYGYRRTRKRFVPHSKESHIVRTIFELHSEGSSTSAMTRALNEDGFRRRNGKVWTRRQVLAIIQRRALYQHGTVRYGSIVAKNQNLIIVGKQAA